MDPAIAIEDTLDLIVCPDPVQMSAMVMENALIHKVSPAHVRPDGQDLIVDFGHAPLIAQTMEAA